MRIFELRVQRGFPAKWVDRQRVLVSDPLDFSLGQRSQSPRVETVKGPRVLSHRIQQRLDTKDGAVSALSQ